MKLGIKRLVSEARMPVFSSDGAACFDLYSIDRHEGVGIMIYSTGLAFDIPDGYCLEVYSRSGHGFNDDLRLANCVGIIDSDYIGEVKVKLTYDGSDDPAWPEVGDRIAQVKLIRLVETELIEVDELKTTDRGDGGMGSTGN